MDLDRIGWAGFSDLIAQVWIGDLAFPEAVTKYSHQHLDPLEIIGEEPWDISLTSMRSNIDPSNLVIQKSGAAHECESNTRLAFEDGAEWSVWGGVGVTTSSLLIHWPQTWTEGDVHPSTLRTHPPRRVYSPHPAAEWKPTFSILIAFLICTFLYIRSLFSCLQSVLELHKCSCKLAF